MILNNSSFITQKDAPPASPHPTSPEQPHSVPQLLSAPVLDLPEGRYPIRLLACGIPEGVNGIVRQLHVLGFAEMIAWSPPLPSPVQGEIIRILTRHVRIRG